VPTAELTDAKRELLDHLKRTAPATVAELASLVGTTETAVRQHLDELAKRGLAVSERGAPEGRGRPAERWSLTELAQDLFPDHHGSFMVGLIGAVREAMGEEGMEQVLEVRRRTQLRDYREQLPGQEAQLGTKVQALARQRTREGYMAEARRDDDGSWLLIEHHCPVCEAATSCQGICVKEWQLFGEFLGPDVDVDREEHLLSGGRRCVYRIREKA